MTRKEFVLGLVRAAPEAFNDVDGLREYDYTDSQVAGTPEQPPDERWGGIVALEHARTWIATVALDVDRGARHARVRAGYEDALLRFFAFIELALERLPRSARSWVEVGLFEGERWTEDVLEYLGPRTVEALREAQQSFDDPVGRWE